MCACMDFPGFTCSRCKGLPQHDPWERDFGPDHANDTREREERDAWAQWVAQQNPAAA